MSIVLYNYNNRNACHPMWDQAVNRPHRKGTQKVIEHNGINNILELLMKITAG